MADEREWNDRGDRRPRYDARRDELGMTSNPGGEYRYQPRERTRYEGSANPRYRAAGAERRSFGPDDRSGPDRSDGDRDWWDKTTDEVSSWFGDEDAQRRRGRDEAQNYRGRGPANYTRSDDRICEDVNDRLTDDPYLDASEMEVRVENGEVTLQGCVGSRSNKHRAEELAEMILGVKHVQNNLRVREMDHHSSSSDDRIRSARPNH